MSSLHSMPLGDMVRALHGTLGCSFQDLETVALLLCKPVLLALVCVIIMWKAVQHCWLHPGTLLLSRPRISPQNLHF